MALSDVLKKYGDSTATEGIMFPSAGVQSVTTEQQVYDSTTDGIMTVTGQQYSLPTYKGPTATVQYGGEEAGYPRMLRQIEQGELPQFKQEDFPKQGEGVMTPSTPVTQPVETTPVQPEQPAVDPCPPGYKLIGGVCQPIQQDRGNNRPTFTGPKISKEGIIDGYESALNRAEGSMLAGGLNSNRMMQLENQFGAEVVAEIGKVNQKYNNRGVQIKEEDPAEIKRLQTVYGQDRIDQDYTFSNGKYYRIIATSPTLPELAGDAGRAVGEIIKGVVETGPIIPKIVNDFVDYFNKDKLSKDFGKLTGADTFGQLQRNIDVANLDIAAATEALQQIANSTKYREERTDKQIDGDIRAQQRKIEKAKQTIEESNDMMQGTSAKKDREIAAGIASDINKGRKSAEQRIKESENRRKAEAEKPDAQKQKEKNQRTKDFKKLSKDLSSFRKNFM